MWQETPYTLPLLAVSVFSIVMVGYALLRQPVPGSKIGALIMLATTEWMLTYTLELASADLYTKVFWNKMQYLGIVTAPTFWFIFAVQYTGHERWFEHRSMKLLPIVPAVTLVLAFTNEYHGLIWSNLILDTDGPFTALINIHGPGFWISAAYSYILMLSGALLFLSQIFTCSRSLFRRQLSVLLLGALVPWGANAFFVTGLNPFPHLDLTPFGLVVTNVTVAVSIVNFRLGDFIPIARKTIIENMGDSVIVLDEENRIVDVNPSAQQLMGDPVQALGEPIEQAWPEWISQTIPDVGMNAGKEIVLDSKDGQRIYDMNISPVVDWRGRAINRIVVLRDITDLKRTEQRIEASLREKEVLLREIHHRVKNNIQVISSLLSLQSHYIEGKTYAEMLKESQDRIKSMALVHEKLYQSENLANIDFGEYVESLVHSLIHSYGVNTERIAVKIVAEGIFLDIDTAIPCGLIINELVSNSLRHAFPGGREGEIVVRLRPSNGTIVLTVSDNGVGMPDSMNLRTVTSLGLHLVTILIEDQLEGEITLDRSKGTTFHIKFKEQRRKNL